jgi:hypothetical protein
MKQAIYLIGFLSVVSGCMSFDAPDGYVRKQRSGVYRIKAVSTDASVVTVRSVSNDDPEKGTLDFWCRAAKKSLTDSRGYVLKEEGNFHSGRGPGCWQTFEHKLKGVDYLYVLGLVVQNKRIWVLEGTGHTEPMTRDLPSMKTSFQTLR